MYLHVIFSTCILVFNCMCVRVLMSVGGYMYNCTTPGGVTLSLVRFLWSQILSRTAPSLFILCLLLYSVCQHYTVWQHRMTFIWYQLELVPVCICNCMCSHLCDCVCVNLFIRWWWGNDIWSVTSVLWIATCAQLHLHWTRKQHHK